MDTILAKLIDVGYDQASSNDEGSVDFFDAVRILSERGGILQSEQEIINNHGSFLYREFYKEFKRN